MAVKFVKRMPPGGALKDALNGVGFRQGKSVPAVQTRVVMYRLVNPLTGEVVGFRQRTEEVPNGD